MAKSNFISFDNLSLNDIEAESELIPLLTTEDEEALSKEDLPDSVPILPLKNTVLFPGVVIPITAGRDKSIQLIKDANKVNKVLLLLFKSLINLMTKGSLKGWLHKIVIRESILF